MLFFKSVCRCFEPSCPSEPTKTPRVTTAIIHSEHHDLEFGEFSFRDKSLSELHEIIIALKTKHYREGLSADERDRWVMARHAFDRKRQKLPKAKGVCSNDIIING